MKWFPSRVNITLALGKHVPSCGQYGVFRSDKGFHRAPSRGDAAELGGEVGPFVAGCCQRCNVECRFGVFVARADVGRLDPSGGFVGAGANSYP